MSSADHLSHFYARQLALLLQINGRLLSIEGALRAMTVQEQKLTDAVTDLATAQQSNVSAMEAEIGKLKDAIAAASTVNENDPDIAAAISRIEEVTASLKASTEAAMEATSPSTPAPVSTDPAPDPAPVSTDPEPSATA